MDEPVKNDSSLPGDSLSPEDAPPPGEPAKEEPPAPVATGWRWPWERPAPPPRQKRPPQRPLSLAGCWFVPFLLAVVWLAFVPLIAQTMDAARPAKEAFLFLSATAFALAAVAVSATRLGSYSWRTLIFAQLFVTCSIGVIVSRPDTVSSRLTGVAALFIFAVAFLWSVIADARSRDRDESEPK